jgi:V/A-type H+-transporting ATPase subunit A
VAAQWEDLRVRCNRILQQEEAIREVAEIVGIEGLQDGDRLLMLAAERIRGEFLGQNAYGDDAFSPPEKTLAIIGEIVYDRSGS